MKNSSNPATVAASGITNFITYGPPGCSGLLLSHSDKLAVAPGIAVITCIQLHVPYNGHKTFSGSTAPGPSSSENDSQSSET